MKGVPVRLEIGPRDIENGQCVAVRRDTRQKYTVDLNEIESFVQGLLEDIHADMYSRAKKHLESSMYVAVTYDEFKKTMNEKPGFVRAMWCMMSDCGCGYLRLPMRRPCESR